MRQKHFGHLPTITLFMALTSVANPLTAMEKEEGDIYHDKAFNELLENNGFTMEHFFSEESNPVLIFDINAATQSHSLRIHKENLKRVAPQSKGILATMGYYLPSLPSWPAFLTVSKTAVPPELPKPVSKKSTPHEFIMVPESEEELPSAPVTIHSDISASSDTPEDFSLASINTVPGAYFGLSVDGGGVRGLLPGIVIEYLEKTTNRPSHQLFDYIGGSSIGGIFSLGLTISKDGENPPMSGSELVDLLINHSQQIFPTHSKWNIPAKLWDKISSVFYTRYSAEPLEALLKEKIGDRNLGHALTNVMVTAVVSTYNEPIILGNRSHSTCLAWQAGRSSSAAPTYFPAFQATSVEGKPYLIDGGIWKNNPSFELAVRIKKLAETKEDHFDFSQVTMLSLGTGDMPITPLPVDGGLIKAAGPLIDTFMQSQSAGVHMTMQSLLEEGKTYFRLDPKLPKVISLDSLDLESAAMLREAAESQFDAVDAFVNSDSFRKKLEGSE